MKRGFTGQLCRIAGLFALSIPAITLVGCDDEVDSMEDVGEEIDDAVDDIGDGLEDIGDRP